MTALTAAAPSVPAPPAALYRLRPRPAARPPVVVRRGDVAASAWTGMHLDGVLVPLWNDASHVAGAAETPALRAAAFAALVPRHGVVGHLAAAWVHAGGAPPHRATVVVRAGTRRPDAHPGRRIAEAALDDADVQELGGVRVTTALRTALDVARWEPAEQALPALRGLVAAGVDPETALRRLEEQAGARGVRAARVVLGLLAPRQARIAGSSAPRDPVTR